MITIGDFVDFYEAWHDNPEYPITEDAGLIYGYGCMLARDTYGEWMGREEDDPIAVEVMQRINKEMTMVPLDATSNGGVVRIKIPDQEEKMVLRKMTVADTIAGARYGPMLTMQTAHRLLRTSNYKPERIRALPVAYLFSLAFLAQRHFQTGGDSSSTPSNSPE